MLQPELFSENNNITIQATVHSMKKYKNLIKWQKQSSILEFGMADGSSSQKNLMPNIPDDFKEFIGSDVSKIMVNYLKKNIEHPKMKFVELKIDAENVMTGFENRFDNIFGFLVMHWVKNQRQAFSNMYKMLKPGGQIFLTFLDETPLDDIKEMLSKHPKWGKYGHINYLSPYYKCSDTKKEVEKYLAENGFVNVVCESDMMNFEFPSEKNFNDFNLAVDTIYPIIPKEEAEAYKNNFFKFLKNGKMNKISYSETRGKTVFESHYKLFVVVAYKPLE